MLIYYLFPSFSIKPRIPLLLSERFHDISSFFIDLKILVAINTSNRLSDFNFLIRIIQRIS